jgi:hypothetical protein
LDAHKLVGSDEGVVVAELDDDGDGDVRDGVALDEVVEADGRTL